MYMMRLKSETFDCYKSFVTWEMNQLGVDIKCLHADRGGEYLSNSFIDYLDKHGTEHKLTVHDTPKENGVAERLNHTLIECVRAMLITSQLPGSLWGKALCHAIWLKNRTWTRALPLGMTPFELLNGEPAELDEVLVWGQVVWVHDTSSRKLGI